jgi:NAD(P)-dependent dehydrogenase (short-subunit alcohol dehydrogenase family)
LAAPFASAMRGRITSRPSSQAQWLIDPLDPSAALAENAHPVYTIRADLTIDRELERVVELTLARFGRIDLVVHAATRYTWSAITDTETYVESLDPQFDLNVKVPLKITALIVRQFWRDRAEENLAHRRNVINVSSISGLSVYPGLGQGIYSASKAALNMLSIHLAHELDPLGVRVNALAPTSFPHLIPTEDVCDAIVQIDQGDATGGVIVLDRQPDVQA